MAESGGATTLYQNSYGNDAFSTILNTTHPKFLSQEVRDLVYGDISKPLSPVMVFINQNAEDNVKTLGQKYVWDFNKSIPTSQFRAFRETINPAYDDDWTQQAEMPTGLVQTDIMIDKALFTLFNAGAEKAVDAYAAFIKRFSISHQEAIVRGIYGDGVQAWDGVSSSTGLVDQEISDNGLPIYGFGWATESASRTNAIMANSNTYAGLDRSAAGNEQHRATLYDATSATDFPAASSPGAITNLTDITIAHLLYVALQKRIGNAYCKHIIVGTNEWLHLMSLAEAKTIISTNGQNPMLAKWGFDSLMINDITIMHDPLFARTGQIIFTNFDETRLVSTVKAELSPVQWIWNGGYKQYYQNITSICQMISFMPGLNALYYGYAT